MTSGWQKGYYWRGLQPFISKFYSFYNYDYITILIKLSRNQIIFYEIRCSHCLVHYYPKSTYNWSVVTSCHVDISILQALATMILLLTAPEHDPVAPRRNSTPFFSVGTCVFVKFIGWQEGYFRFFIALQLIWNILLLLFDCVELILIDKQIDHLLFSFFVFSNAFDLLSDLIVPAINPKIEISEEELIVTHFNLSLILNPFLILLKTFPMNLY